MSLCALASPITLIEPPAFADKQSRFPSTLKVPPTRISRAFVSPCTTRLPRGMSTTLSTVRFPSTVIWSRLLDSILPQCRFPSTLSSSMTRKVPVITIVSPSAGASVLQFRTSTSPSTFPSSTKSSFLNVNFSAILAFTLCYSM